MSLYLTHHLVRAEKSQKKKNRKSNEMEDAEERLLPAGKLSKKFSIFTYMLVLNCYLCA